MAITIDGKCITDMKYHDLQKLAKSVGVKANLKIEKLLQALTEYYRQKDNNSDENSSEKEKSSEESATNSDNEDSKAKRKRPPPKKAKKRGRKNVKAAPQDETDSADNVVADSKSASNMTDQNKSVLSSVKHTPDPSSTSTVKSGSSTPRQKAASADKRQNNWETSSLTPQMKAVIQKRSLSSQKRKRSPSTTKQGMNDKNDTARSSSTPAAKRQKQAAAAVHSQKSSGKHTSLSRTTKTVAARSSTPFQKGGNANKQRQAGEKSSLTPQMKAVILKRNLSPDKRKCSLLSAKQKVKQSQPARFCVELSVKRRRRSTFDKTPEGLAGTTPTIEPSSKRSRRSTYDKTPQDVNGSATPAVDRRTRRSTFDKPPAVAVQSPASPGVDVLLHSMKYSMDSAERKQSLMTAIASNVKAKCDNGTPATGIVETAQTNIPRFAAFVNKNKQGTKKPITPGNKDWKKIHNKEFSKFDSIDVYLEKKKKRNQMITASVKKAHQVLEETKAAVSQLKSLKTPNNENKPKQLKKADVKANLFQSKKVTPFKPTVLKTTSMNFNFTKTPQTAGPAKCSKTADTQEKPASTINSNYKSKRTPTAFKFTATLNTTGPALNATLSCTKKTIFDLKASLSRPITWKVHKGKLKPLTDVSEPKYLYTEIASKTPKTQSRDDRRKAAEARRVEKKQQLQMKRRGIKC